MTEKMDREKAADIVRAAGGKIVGRTRLQKVAYLLEAAGLGDGFFFSYHHYGPYSEDLSQAIRNAEAFDLVQEKEDRASWGGRYSIYTAKEPFSGDDARRKLAQTAALCDAVELELAATAVYLAKEENCVSPWAETERRKPEKAGGGRLRRAQEVYERLRSIETPCPLPDLTP